MMNTTYYEIDAYYSVYHSKGDEIVTSTLCSCSSKKTADLVLSMLKNAYTGLGFTMKLKDSTIDKSQSDIITVKDKTDFVALLNSPFKDTFKTKSLTRQTEFDLSKSESLKEACTIIYASPRSAGSSKSLQGKTIKHIVGVYQKEAIREVFEFLGFLYSKSNFVFTGEHFINKSIFQSTTESLKWVEISDVVYRVLPKLDLNEYRRLMNLGEEKAIEWKQV